MPRNPNENPFARVMAAAASPAPSDAERRELGDGYEIMSREVQAVDIAAQEFPLFSTTKPWPAIDVVRFTSSASDCWLRLNVYAIVGGMRALVGGSLSKPPADVAAALPELACQVREVAEQFLVTACVIGDVAADLTYRIAAIASDRATAPVDPDAGVWRLGVAGAEGLISPNPTIDVFSDTLDNGVGPDVELVAVEVFNNNAARRFLHVYDQARVGGGLLLANLRQVIDLPASGSAFRRFPSSRRAVNRYRNGLIFAASTSAPAFLAAGAADLHLSAWVR